MFTPAEFRARLLPIGLAQVVGLLCGVVGVRLMSYLVAPADYGLYGVFTSLVPAGMWLVFAGLSTALSRLWAAAVNRPALLHSVLVATLHRAGWLGLLAGSASLLVSREHWAALTLLLFAAVLFLGLGHYAHVMLQATREHWRDLRLSAVDSITRTGLPPLLYVLSGAVPLSLPTGYMIHTLFGMLVGAWLLRTYLRPAGKHPDVSVPDIYHGPVFLGLAIAGWVLGGANRWLVAASFGTEIAGYFTLASNIAIILPSMLGTMMVQYLQPGWFAAGHVSSTERAALARRVDRAAGFYAAAAFALTLLLHFIMPWFIGPLVSEQYRSASIWVLGAGAFTVAVTTGRFYTSLLFAGRLESATARVELAAAGCYLLGGVLTAVLGPEWFRWWLIISPVVPWLVSRPLARRRLLEPA